jgi:RNA polymerase sigma-70 factor, ECF subfamily
MAKNKVHSEFMTWYEPIHEGFVRYCSVRSFGVMETEDVVQESVLVALQNFDKIRDKKALLAYLMRTASNLIGAKARRAKFSSPKDIDGLAHLHAHVPDPALALDIAELYKALNTLDTKQREAVIMFEISGFSMKEIAELQESSEGAVKVRIHRGREKLKKLLTEKEKLVDLEMMFKMIAVLTLS